MRPPVLAHLAGLAVLAALLLGVAVPWRALVAAALEAGGWGEMLPGRAVAERVLDRLAFTTLQAALSTALALALGLPAALLFASVRVPGAHLWRAVFTVPFVMPSVVAAIAVLAWVGPRGYLGVDLRDTIWIVLLAHAAYNVGVVVRVVGGHLEAMAPRLHEAAAVLGAGGWSRLRRVTLPIAVPAIVAAATLVFLFCFTSFGVIMILAPSPALATLEVEIYRAVARRLDLVQAAAVATLQLVVVMALVTLYTRWQRRAATAVPRTAVRPPPPRGARSWLLVVGAMGLAATVTLSPLLALLAQALWAPGTPGPSIAGFVAAARPSPVIGLTDLGSALSTTLWTAAAATALALLFGAAAAYAVVRGRWRLLDPLTLLPLATSAVTLGLGVLLAYPDLAAAPAAIPVAHALLAFPFVARTLIPAWRALERGLLDAAANLGAGPSRTAWRIELPLLRPAFLTAAGFAAAVSIGEFGAALLLRRPETATLPVAVFERLGRPGAARYAEALAMAAVLLLLTALVVLSFELLGRRRRVGAGRTEF